MGTWGTALFSDDTATDIRDAFNDLLGDGLSTAEATDLILSEHTTAFADPEVGPAAWLGLAATQWKLGRRDERVHQKALAILAGGGDLERWQGRDRARRREVLEALRKELLCEPPPPKPVRKRYRNACDWGVGEVIAYRLPSGAKVLLRTIGHWDDRGGRSAICELLDWQGEKIPSALRLRFVGIRKRADPAGRLVFSQFILGAITEREIPTDRIERPGLRLPPAQSPHQPRVVLWRALDAMLREDFGLS